MDIFIKVRNVYGNNLAYPDCRNSKRFAELANTETLTPRSLKIIQQLGFKIKVRADTFGLIDGITGIIDAGVSA